MKKQINDFWNKHFGADLFSSDGSEVKLNEDHAAKLQGLDEEIDSLRAENATLKDEAGTSAQSISDLEAKVTAAEDAAKVEADKITAALTEHGVEVAEDANAADLAVEKINAWAAGTGKPTTTTTTVADNVEGENKRPEHYSKTDADLKALKEQHGLS